MSLSSQPQNLLALMQGGDMPTAFSTPVAQPSAVSALTAPQTSDANNIALQDALGQNSAGGSQYLPGQVTAAATNPALANLLYAQNLSSQYDANSDVG